VILYEHPFNERIRTYLRLEHLFRRLNVLVAREHAVDHHFALTTVFEIIDVAARSELKSEILRDLEKQKQTLNSYRGNPAISEQALDKVIAQLDQCFGDLNAQTGKAGQVLTENDWLMNIRSRVSIPGGTFEFDLPAYHAWQQGQAAKRQADLARWSTSLGPLAQSLHWLLKLLRDAGTPQKVIAVGGQFQQNLPQGRTFQLLRLRIDPTLGLIPEISGNRLMVSVRLMRLEADDRLHPCGSDAAFDLTLCC
jgi:cell division protein ZapD